MNPYNQDQSSERIAYTYATDPGDAYFQRERFNHTHDVLARSILLIGSSLSTLLIARFVLSLFAANPANTLVAFIQLMTQPFLLPFYGLFNTESLSIGSSIFEGYTLLALLAYSALTALAVRLVTLTRY